MVVYFSPKHEKGLVPRAFPLNLLACVLLTFIFVLQARHTAPTLMSNQIMKSNSHLKKNHSKNRHVALQFLLLAKALIKSAEWFLFSSSDFRCSELPKHFFYQSCIFTFLYKSSYVQNRAISKKKKKKQEGTVSHRIVPFIKSQEKSESQNFACCQISSGMVNTSLTTAADVQ